jgi:hypothetical protein
VRLRVARGDPSTPANEADVRINASITDVVDRLRDVDPYVGELQAQVAVRVTDRLNGADAADSATVTEYPLSVDMPCVPDLPTGGSTCRASTTMNALLPGSVAERARAVWQLGAVQVLDGGEDGVLATPDNGLLASQGLFVP